MIMNAQLNHFEVGRNVSGAPLAAGIMNRVLLLIWLVISPMLVGCRQSSNNLTPHPAVGKKIEKLDLLRLDPDAAAQQTELPAMETDWPSGLVLMHFWGTWCGPCRMEYPELSEMMESFKDRPGIRFYSISTENTDDATYESLTEETFEFFRQNNIDHDVYCDPRGQTRLAVSQVTGVPHLFFPTSILVDSDQKVLWYWEGYDSDGVDQMREKILAHLDQ
jgi:cytochrome c biogenesis protein CcmG, thiol:disulfide interchange protein DsbE